MTESRKRQNIILIVLLIATTSWALPPIVEGQLPLDPARDSGLSVTAAYEGWFRNADGSYSLLIGYFNRNHKQTLDIPVGDNNRIEPGGPDQGQPTHFLPRRNWGVFAVRVPQDFPGKKLTWTIVANGETTEIPMGLDPLWEVEPWKDGAQGNTPPTLKFAADGKAQQGPPEAMTAAFDAVVGQTKTIQVWAEDDGLVDAYRRTRRVQVPKVRLEWSKFRGPGEVHFDNTKPDVDFDHEGLASVNIEFSEPGDYVLRLQANDVSGNGGGGAQCCWTNALVKVSVQAAVSSQ